MNESKHTHVKVQELPKCNFCDKPARYDANLGMAWGNVCQDHFNQFGCSLGLGKGQELITS
jgi:hypothetical protein